jgi:hypothetical protein
VIISARFFLLAHATATTRVGRPACGLPFNKAASIVANTTASTQYLAALSGDRRAAPSTVRKLINENLPDPTACSVK